MEDGLKMGERFQRGEERAFDFFFAALFKKLVYYAYKFVHDEDIANDVAQHTFLAVWGKREILSHPKVIRDYLYTTARNRCLTLLDKKKKDEERSEGLNCYELSRLAPPEADNKVIASEVKAITHNWINRLPKECKKIMELMYIHGFTAVETAKILKLDISTVKNQKANALVMIRGIVEGEYRPRVVANVPIIPVELPQPAKEPEKPKFIPWRKKKAKLKLKRKDAEILESGLTIEEQIFYLYNEKYPANAIAVHYNISTYDISHIVAKESRKQKISLLLLENTPINIIAKQMRLKIEAIESIISQMKIA